MALNIANIEKLLAFMRALPPEHFSMEWTRKPACGSPGCIIGCADSIFEHYDDYKLGLGDDATEALFMPEGWIDAEDNGLFPLARAIDVVQHLRDTGEVDWDRFPPSLYRQPPAAPKPAWTPTVVIAIEPELPESLTSLLRQPVEVGDG